MRALIVAGGDAPKKELLQKYIKQVEYVIGADRGNDCLMNYGFIPDIALGDFDSIDKKILLNLENENVQIIRFKPEKDYTDTEIAIREALKKGAKKIYLFGATGCRIDHMLGNIGLLLWVKNNNCEMEIIDDNNKMYLAKNNMEFHGSVGENISFHALSDTVKNFKISGAKYNLGGQDVNLLYPRAICNEFVDSPIYISYDSGELLVIYSND